MRHLTVQQLSASLDGALVGVSLELVVRHLATCRECRARHARLSKQDDTLRHLLAWDPGAEYFEDASIRLETILDAQSRGVAPPRVAEIEAHLPRVTLDDVLRAAQAATVMPCPEPSAAAQAPTATPCPEPSAAAPSSEKPTLQFPAWMQPETNRPVTPRPVPREPRKPTTPIEPVVLARKEPPVVVPVIIPEPEPVQVAPMAPVIIPELEPIAVVVPEPALSPAPAPAPAPAPETVPSRVAPSVVAPRRAIPRWVRPLAFSAASITMLLAALSALPPVIRIPEPQLPRFPRIELVKRQPKPTPETTLRAAATEPTASVPEASVVPPVTVAALPTLIEPVLNEPEPRDVVVHDPPSNTTVHAAPATAQPAAPQNIPVRRTPAPIALVVPVSTPHVESPTTTSDVDPAADWPLLCGEVLDDTGTPVAGARVLLADLDLGARTDKRGRFCLAAPPGDRTLSVVALGFASARQVVSLGTQTLEVHISLHPAP